MYQGPLYICADHGGYRLKKRLVRYIQNELKRDVVDMGADKYDELDDFPKYMIPTALAAVENNGRAILICGSGTGACISANKVVGMRAALGYNIEAAELSVQHNNANGLCLAGRVLTEDHAMTIVKKWLEAEEFIGGKYQKRNEMIDEYEKNKTIPELADKKEE